MSNESKIVDAALSSWDAQEAPEDFARKVMALDAARRVAGQAPVEDLGSWRPRGRGVRVFAYAAAAAASLSVSAALLWPAQTPEPAAVVPSPEAQAEDPFEFGETFVRDLDAQVRSYGEKYGDGFAFHGVVLAGTTDRVVVEKAYGRAVLDEDSRNRLDTRFRLGSLTMPMMAALTLRLSERGDIGLDETVGQYFPELPEHQQAFLNTVTVHHLLTHTSGIANFTDGPFAEDLMSGKDSSLDTVRRMLEWSLKREGGVKPGEEMNPTNTGFLILGLALERKLKTDLAALLRTEVFEPAGMKTASLGVVPPQGPGVARGHEFNEATEFLTQAPAVDPAAFGGSAGVVGTARDVWAFVAALDDGILLRPESLELMGTEHVSSYGYGLAVGWGHGQPVMSHPGGLPGFNGAMIWLRRDNVVVVVLANTEVVDARDLVAAGAAIAVGEEPLPHLEYDEVPYDTGSFADFVGHYELTKAAREQVIERHGAGAIHTLGAVSIEAQADRLLFAVPLHGKKWMHGLAQDTFFFKDGPGTTAQVGTGASGARWLTVRQGKRVLTYVQQLPED